MTDWGVPDWTDEAAYLRKITDREWWWQFTRRRPDYREYYTPATADLVGEHHVVLPVNHEQTLGQLEKEIVR